MLYCDSIRLVSGFTKRGSCRLNTTILTTLKFCCGIIVLYMTLLFPLQKLEEEKKALCVPYMVMLPLFWGWMSSTDSICWLKVQPVGLKATSWSYWREKRARWSCSFWKEKGKREGEKGQLKRAALSGVFLPQHGPGGVRTICVTVLAYLEEICAFSRHSRSFHE